MSAGRTLLVFLVVALAGIAIYALVPRSDPITTLEVEFEPVVCRDAVRIGDLLDVREASGLAPSRVTADVLWSHNDSGEPVLYAIGLDGRPRGRVRVTGAAVDDWEAIATAPCPAGSCVYIADIGDNNAQRQRITIYRTTEPAPSDTATKPVEALHATYPDGPQDAESLFATPEGGLFIVTKGESGPVKLYRLPTPVSGGAPLRLQQVVSLTTTTAQKTSRVTDAAISPDGQWVAFRTGDALLFYRASELMSGKPRPPIAFDVRQLKEPQGEGLAWARDNTLYLAGEGSQRGTLARISCNLPLI